MSGHTKSSLVTVDQVKEAMAELVLVHCELARKMARAEAKIADIKAVLEGATKEDRAKAAALSAELALFVQTNPKLFEKPRSVKHAGATIGWEKASDVQLTDPEEIVATMIEAAIEKANAADDAELADRLGACIKVTAKVMKTGVKDAVLNGVAVPGCVVRETDQPFVRLDNKLLKAAEEEARKGGAA